MAARSRAAALLTAVPLMALAEPAVRVTRDADLYTVSMQAAVQAPASAACDAFIRYENLPRINPAVEEVQRREGAPAGAARLYTQVRVCVGYFCKHLKQVQDMRSSADGTSCSIDAQVLPEQSDLKRGKAHWHIAPCDSGSCLDFHAELEPDFWVPPLIGPWLIQRKLRQEALVTVDGLERVAHESAP